MTASATESTSAAKATWFVALIFVAWLVFLLVPFPRPEPPAAPPPLVGLASRLQKVGLPDFPEWDALPDIFAIWAYRADWNGNKTRFAYWNPGANDYTYFFEATRTAQGFRFREIAKPPEYRAYEAQYPDGVPTSEEHPLLLIRRASLPPLYRDYDVMGGIHQREPGMPLSVPVDIPKPDIQPPPATIPINRDLPPSAPPK